MTKQFENLISENMNDRINHTLDSLKKSKFRSKFKLSQKDRDYIDTKGLETIKEHAFQYINSRVAPEYPKNDGKQTPMRGHPVFIAQHATATCCRGCISKWHGFEKGRALNDAEVDFVVGLIMGWIEGQVMKKRGEPSDNSGNLLPPLSYSLLQPLEEHAGRLKRDNPDLLYPYDTPNTSSWFSSQPQDERLKLKAVQSL